MTDEVVGTWLCPGCSPNATFYIKQLVKRRVAPPHVTLSEKMAKGTPSRTQEQEQTSQNKGIVRKGVAVKKPAPSLPTRLSRAVNSHHFEEESAPAAKKRLVVKKGVAVTKPTAESAKPKWVGWVELPSDEEEEYKKNVEAKFWTEDAVKGKRTRSSKTTARENENGTRRLRTRSRPVENISKMVATDSDSWSHVDFSSSDSSSSSDGNYKEQEEQDASIQTKPSRRRAPATEETSNDHEDLEDSEDTMDTPARSEESNFDELYDVSDAEEERDVSPTSDVLPMEVEEDQGQNGSNNISNYSEYPNDNDESAPTKDLSRPSRVRRMVVDSSSSSSSAEPISPAGLSATSPEAPASPLSEDSMDVDEDEGDEKNEDGNDQGWGLGTVLYQRQGDCWGEYPESAVRSTLPL